MLYQCRYFFQHRLLFRIVYYRRQALHVLENISLFLINLSVPIVGASRVDTHGLNIITCVQARQIMVGLHLLQRRIQSLLVEEWYRASFLISL